MSDQKYIAQAIIASLCAHPDQDKYKNRAFAGENLKKVMDAMAGKGQKIGKSDFFTPDDDGKFIIDTPGFWRNFDQILSILNQNGEFFRAEDFSKPLNGREDGRTLLDSALQHNGLAEIFAVKTWAGHYDDMERLWYHVSFTQRQNLFKNDGHVDPKMKRALLKMENAIMPEDALVMSGLKQDDLTKAFNDASGYNILKKTLHAHGDYLRKAYVLLPDREGNTIFARESAWVHYEDIVKTMAEHGERLEIADLVRQNGTRLNILARAAENNALHRVFTPEHWAGHLPDMLTVWSYVLPGWKKGLSTAKDFDLYYSQAEDLTYSGWVTAGAVTSRDDLVQPLDISSGQKVLPLGLKSTWDRFDEVSAGIAAAKGKHVTLADLRDVSGGLGHSCLMSAVKFGAFDKVVKHLRQSGEQLALPDFLSKDRHGVTMIDILAERNELFRAFTPELWIGRVADMKTLWNHVKVSDRKQIDIHQVEVAVKQATLKQSAKNNFKFPGGPF